MAFARPRLATATLARLYLAQGHVETARAMSRALVAQGAPEADGVRHELAERLASRERVLTELLATVCRRRAQDGAGRPTESD